MMMSMLHELVWENLERHEDLTAIVYDDGQDKVVLTYTQMRQIAKQVTDLLASYHTTGEIIGVCARPDQYIIPILLGILDVGSAFYYFETSAEEFVSNVVESLHVKYLLVNSHHLQTLEKVLFKLQGEIIYCEDLYLMDLVMVGLKSVTRKKHGGNLAYCITTSGTTGRPKVVRVPHRCIVPNILHIRNLYKVTSDDCTLLCSPLTFDPSMVEIFTSLSTGGTLLMVPEAIKVVPRVLLNIVCYRNPVTVMQCTPTFLLRMDPGQLKQTLLGPDSVLRVLSLGGEKFPHPSAIRQRQSPGNGTTFFNMYGTTEVSCWSAWYKLTDTDLLNDIDIPLGKSLQDTNVCVIQDGRILTEGQGQIFLGGSSRQCMLTIEEEDKYDPRQCVLRETGDQVKVMSDGSLYYIGRLDEQVKRHGKRINLNEIGLVSKKLTTIADCCTVFKNNTLILTVVHKSSEVVSMEAFVRDHLRSHLPSQYQPDHIIFCAALPMTKHGKVDKEAVYRMFLDKQAKSDTSSTDGWSAVENIWKDILNVPKSSTIDPQSKFISSGGDSLSAILFSDRLESVFAQRFSALLDHVLQNTYSEIQQYLKDQVKSKVSDVSVSLSNSGEEEISRIDDVKFTEKQKEDYFSETDVDHVEDSHKRSVLFSQKRTFTAGDGSSHQTSNKITKMPKLDLAYLKKAKYFPSVLSVSRGNRILCIVDENRERTKDGSTSDTDHQHCRNMETEDIVPGDGINISDNTGKISVVKNLVCKNRLDSFNYKTVNNQLVSKTSAKYTYRHSTNPQDCSVKLEEVWRFNTGKCVDASPLIVVNERTGSSSVFIGSHSHSFGSVSLTTGRLLWETVLGDRVESSACLGPCGRFIVVGCYDGNVYTLEKDSGVIWWAYQTGGEVKSSPTHDPMLGLVYVGSHDKNIHALDLHAKQLIWKRSTGGSSVFSSPVVCTSPHCVYVGTLAGKLLRLNPVSGDVVWRYDCGKPLFSSPCVTNAGVYIGCVNNCLYHVDHKGQLLWKYTTGAPIFSSPAVLSLDMLGSDVWKTCDGTEQIISGKDVKGTQECIVIGSHDCHVHCVTVTGVLLWKVKLDSQVYAAPFPISCSQFGSKFNLMRNFKTSGCTLITGYETHGINVEAGAKEHFLTKEKCLGQTVKLDTSEFKGGSNSYLHIQDTCNIRQQSHAGVQLDTAVINTDKDTERVPPVRLKNMGKTCKEQSDNRVRTDFENQSRYTGGTKLDECETRPERAVELIHNGQNSTEHWDIGTYASSGRSDAVAVYVVCASTSGTVYVVDAGNGDIVCRYCLPGEVFSSPVVFSDMVTVGCRDDFVYGLKLIGT